MIESNICLILGAGASSAYGLPLGSSLLEQIVNETSEEDSPIRESLISVGFTEDFIDRFSDELNKSHSPSIDMFLLRRNEYLEIGKLAIALILSLSESNSTPLARNNNQNWMAHIFTKMDSDLDDFHKNKINFITFNYDRTLEYFLSEAVKAKYGITKSQALSIINKLDILHLHGKIGDLSENSQSYIPFTNDGYDHILHYYKRNRDIPLKLYHENIYSDISDKVALICSQSDVFCFLGFGYAKENIEKISPHIARNKLVYGSTFGLSRTELANLEKNFGGHPITKDSSHPQLLEFIKNNINL